MASKPESLKSDHILERFDCGNPSLSDWLKKHALQSQAARQTKTMVIADEKVVIGYYSYNVISVEHEDSTPERVKKGLAKYPIPIFLIARLAIDSGHQGKGLGSKLLLHALKGAVAIANAENGVPIRAVVVDAIDETARDFYTRFDFQPFPLDTLRLWLLMKDLEATLNFPRK